MDKSKVAVFSVENIMPTLKVKDFSCIAEAHIELAPITVIIGPQASGKSVLSKLMYFFCALMRDQNISFDEKKTFDSFKEQIREKFSEWFPSSAWGSRKFCIDFKAGEYEIRIMRTEYLGKLGDNVRISCSAFVERFYHTLEKAYGTATANRNDSDPRLEFDLFWKIRERSDAMLEKALRNEFIKNQLFVPAGRSFFTSIGKAIAAFEQTRLLDPLTASFGRTFASFREPIFYVNKGRIEKRSMMLLSKELLGGTLKFEKDKEYVVSSDGRKIPFSALSSGQQELIPLLLVVSMFTVGGEKRSGERRVIYIEEPEAHLFPSAQSTLVTALSGLVVSGQGSLDMIVTTHSPYVLAKLNNLLKAGTLAETEGIDAEKVNKIVPRQSWLTADMFRAYAIVGNTLISITDSDGLIDATYLDEVSGEISREFSSLLEVEFEK